MRFLMLIWMIFPPACGGALQPSKTDISEGTEEIPEDGNETTLIEQDKDIAKFEIDEEGLICDGSFPLQLLMTNIAATDLSALVRVETSSVTGPDGYKDPPSYGYVNHRYEVSLLHIIKGLWADRLVFLEMAEAGVQPHQPKTVLLVSLCAGDEVSYTPDNCYALKVSECVQEFAQGLKPNTDYATLGDACVMQANLKGEKFLGN
jgi:hypothetical protein